MEFTQEAGAGGVAGYVTLGLGARQASLSFLAVILEAVRTAVLLSALVFFQTWAPVSAVILSTAAVVGRVCFPSALRLAFHCSMFITAPCLFKLYRVISKLACLNSQIGDLVCVLI